MIGALASPLCPVVQGHFNILLVLVACYRGDIVALVSC